MDNKIETSAPQEKTKVSWQRRVKNVLCVLFYLAVGVGVFWLAFQFSDGMDLMERMLAISVTTSIGVMVAIMIFSPIFNALAVFCGRIVNHLFKMPLQDIVCAVLGLIIGLVIASLLNGVVGKIPVIGEYFAVLSLLFFSYIGMVVAYRKRSEFMSLFNWRAWQTKNSGAGVPQPAVTDKKILDTNVIIDGRIADICRSGFLEGQLLVPNFVLDELRHIADLPDVLRRNRGRRGLDILNRMQKEMPGRIEIMEVDYPEIAEVDNKLLRMAQDLKCQVITNDYNLGKVAQVQGVKILNINELADALRAVWLPGETISVNIVQAGKEPNQGLAFLDDGTMIVVENGRQYIGQQMAVEVSSVLQTSAGRMIFARILGN